MRAFVVAIIIALTGCEGTPIPVPDQVFEKGGAIIFRSGQSTICDKKLVRKAPGYLGVRDFVCYQKDGHIEFSGFDVAAFKVFE